MTWLERSAKIDTTTINIDIVLVSTFGVSTLTKNHPVQLERPSTMTNCFKLHFEISNFPQFCPTQNLGTKVYQT